MQKRIVYANATILQHVKVLIYEVGAAHEPALLALAPDAQLEVLLMNVTVILQSVKVAGISDEDGKIEKPGNSLRMKGINQSYSMFDA